jgi:hypothetical protein
MLQTEHNEPALKKKDTLFLPEFLINRTKQTEILFPYKKTAQTQFYLSYANDILGRYKKLNTRSRVPRIFQKYRSHLYILEPRVMP